MDKWLTEGMALSCVVDGRGLSSNDVDVPCTASSCFGKKHICSAGRGAFTQLVERSLKLRIGYSCRHQTSREKSLTESSCWSTVQLHPHTCLDSVTHRVAVPNLLQASQASPAPGGPMQLSTAYL